MGIVDTSYQDVRLTTRLIAGKALQGSVRAITKAYDSNVELYELSIYRVHITPEKN